MDRRSGESPMLAKGFTRKLVATTVAAFACGGVAWAAAATLPAPSHVHAADVVDDSSTTGVVDDSSTTVVDDSSTTTEVDGDTTTTVVDEETSTTIVDEVTTT